MDRVAPVSHPGARCHVVVECVFPTLGITRELPVNQQVVIDIPVQRSGEVPFRCGMNMVKAP